MSRLRSLVSGFFRRDRVERDLADEIAFHIEARARALEAEGLDPVAACRHARLEFGSVERYKEEVRAGRGLRLADELGADLRSGWRTLRRAPAFTLVAALSLALGIGANTLVFSLVDATLLRPLDVPAPDRLVTVWNVPDLAQPATLGTNSIARYIAVRDSVRAFSSVAAHNGLACGIKTLGFEENGGTAERILGQTVSPSMFRTLGVEPRLGRTFTEDEDIVDQVAPVIILSDGTWRQRFGGDPAIVGRTITVDERATTVVGVMPPGFDVFGERVEFFMPLCLTRVQVEGRVGGNTIIARLRSGVTPALAQAELDGLAMRLAADDPARHRGLGFRIEPLQRARARLFGSNGQPSGDYAGPLLILQGAVLFVLLIACANVAGLLLARTSGRKVEMAVRLALGASRWRVIRQLMTESLPLALAGAAGGVALAWAGLTLFVATAPPDFPRLAHVGIELRALGFTALMVVITTVVCAAVPALQASRVQFTGAFKASARGSTSDARRRRLRNALVTAQIALSLVLLIGAGLMIHSFVRVLENDLGANPVGVLTFDFRYPQRGSYRQVRMFQGTGLFEVDPRPAEMAERVLERLQTLPGVKAAGALNRAPFGGGSLMLPFRIDGRELATGAGSTEPLPTADYIAVTHGFFAAMDVPVRRGRGIDRRDDGRAPFVVVINDTMARQFFGDRDPIGAVIRFAALPEEPARQIVGVAGDLLSGPFQNRHEPAVYVPHLQQTPFFTGPAVVTRIGMNFVVRTSTEPMAMLSAIKAAVAEVDPATPVANAESVVQTLDAQVRHMRLYVLMLAAFGAVSALLAAIGIYGVMAHAVAERTREIGIRMALGARLPDVLRMVLGHAALLVGAGVATGLAAALALGRLIEASLFRITATDPATYVGVAGLLTVVAALACLVPTRRAATVDPTVALRAE